VKAYRGALPSGEKGVEFTTPVAPQKGSGTLRIALWYYPHTPGVGMNSQGFAWIPVNISKVVI
jgi:hypothetical protein